MLSDFIASAYVRVRPHRFVMLACVGIALALAAFLSSRFFVQENIRALMPSAPQNLVENFEILREAPFLRRLTITVGGPGHDPIALADTLAGKLRGDLIPTVVAGSDVKITPAFFARLCDFAPSLMNSEDFSHMPFLLEAEAMGKSLDEGKRTLLSPRGLALRELVAKDPLNIRSILFARLASSAVGSSGGGFGERKATLENGHIVDATGRYAMLLAEPAAPMSDSVAATKVMEHYREAVNGLPQGVTALIVGGHRHTQENAAAVKGDLGRVLPVSMFLLALLFMFFIRTTRGVWLFLLPAASLLVALFVSGVLLGAVSGIVVGFGSVVIGITADYAIHVFFAVRGTSDTEEALRLVARPLSIGAATTLAAFSALLFSVIPAISQMAVFAMAGICAAFVLALGVLPHCLALFPKSCEKVANNAVFSAIARPQSRRLTGRAEFKHRGLAFAWAAVAACMVYFALTVPVDGDIRKLAYTPPEVRADEEETGRIWGTARDGALVVAQGEGGDAGLEEALQVNDAVWRIFQTNGYAGSKNAPSVTSLAPMLPSRKAQKERHAAWRSFWGKEKGAVMARLDALRGERGFSEAAFAPFSAWLDSEPAYVTPETLTAFGLEQVVDMMHTVTLNDKTLLFTLVPKEIPMLPELVAELEGAGARVLFAGEFREDLSHATRNDCLRFCLLSFLAIGSMLFLFFPSFSRWALAMSPLVAGALVVTAAFRLFGLSMTVFHAAALPLIMGLAADYGIFMVSSLEQGGGGTARKAVLLSGLTTLSGFGSLVLAKHPALFSLGVTVSAGLGVAVVVALWGLPRIGRVRQGSA